MRTLGIIPARGGSKRLPRKNIRLLNGKPLVAWAIEAAKGASRIDRLVVSSDDDEILEVARTFGPTFPLRRPANLATDTSLAIEFVQHALAELECADNEHFDAVAVVQPSSPLTQPADIDCTLQLLENSGADSAVTVVQVEHAFHPAKFKTMNGDRLLPYYENEDGRMASHQLPTVYVRNCSVYALRRQTIDAGELLGDDCRGYVMPRVRSIDINDELDWRLIEFLCSNRI